MTESINFVKAHWDPKVYNREVSIANSLTFNISSAADPLLGIFTPEQCKELKALRRNLLDFMGVPGRERIRQLRAEGLTIEEQIDVMSEETLQKWGVK